MAPFLLGGTLTTGILLTVVSRTEQIPVLLGAASIAGAAQSVVLVTYLTARTNLSPDQLLGRVGSTARTISLGLQPIGMLVGGALIDLTDGSTTLAAMGLVLVVLTLAFRADRRASAGDDATECPVRRLGGEVEHVGWVRRDLDGHAAALAGHRVEAVLDLRLTGTHRAIDADHLVDSLGPSLVRLGGSLIRRRDS